MVWPSLLCNFLYFLCLCKYKLSNHIQLRCHYMFGPQVEIWISTYELFNRESKAVQTLIYISNSHKNVNSGIAVFLPQWFWLLSIIKSLSGNEEIRWSLCHKYGLFFDIEDGETFYLTTKKEKRKQTIPKWKDCRNDRRPSLYGRQRQCQNDD